MATPTTHPQLSSSSSSSDPGGGGQGAVNESSTIVPSMTYRFSSMQKSLESVYWKDEYKNAADQIYATVRFERTYDYRHSFVVEPSFRTIRNNPKRMDDVILEQAFIESAPFKNHGFFVTAGKKTEYEGAGFMLNPSDLLNEDKDLFDPLYQKEGKSFLRARYRFDAASVALGYIPKKSQDAEKGAAWLQGSLEVGEAELKLQMMHGERDKTTTGVSASYFLTERLELHWDGRYQARQRDPADSPQLRFLGFSSYKERDSSGYYLAGSRFVVSPRRTVILEGIQQQSGLRSEELGEYIALLRQEKTDNNRVEEIPTRLQGRRYGFISYQDDETIQGSHLGLSYLQNVNDDSFFATANYTYHFSPISSFELNTMVFHGTQASEFGQMPFPRALTLVFRGKF